MPGACSIMRVAISRVGTASGCAPRRILQDVVLLHRDAVRLDGRREAPLQLVAGPQQGDPGLLERRLERLLLTDLFLDLAFGHRKKKLSVNN